MGTLGFTHPTSTDESQYARDLITHYQKIKAVEVTKTVEYVTDPAEELKLPSQWYGDKRFISTQALKGLGCKNSLGR